MSPLVSWTNGTEFDGVFGLEYFLNFSKLLSYFVPSWEPTWRRVLCLSHRAKGKSPLTRFNPFFWSQMNLIHRHAWEVRGENKTLPRKDVSSPGYKLKLPYVRLWRWTSLFPRRYFYSSCSRAILPALPLGSEMTLGRGAAECDI